MEQIVLTCPFCGEKLETSAENAGRNGQCPGCEGVFEVRPTAAGGGVPLLDSMAPREFEYRNIAVLAGPLAVGALLIVMAAAAAVLPWAHSESMAAQAVRDQRLPVFAISVVCCVALAVSLLSGKSLVPPVLVAGAWGMVSVFWMGGMMAALVGLSREAQGMLGRRSRELLALRAGPYVTLVAGLLLVVGAVYVYYRCRQGGTFRRLGLFLVATQVVAIVVGLAIMSMHVRPAIHDTLQSRKVGTPAAVPASLSGAAVSAGGRSLRCWRA